MWRASLLILIQEVADCLSCVKAATNRHVIVHHDELVRAVGPLELASNGEDGFSSISDNVTVYLEGLAE